MGCPPLDEMKMVVVSAGGSWLPQIPKVLQIIVCWDICGCPIPVYAFDMTYDVPGTRWPFCRYVIGLICSTSCAYFEHSKTVTR